MIVIILIFPYNSFSQKDKKENSKKEPPKFKLTRAEDNYDYLKKTNNNLFTKNIFDPIKFISLQKGEYSHITIGGQFRPRFEHYSNRFWLTEEDQNFYSQRLAFHTNVVIGKYLRVFGEVYHGYTSHQKEFAEYDELDLFQAFLEIKVPAKNKSKFSFRFGRQEMGLGATRLIGIREGPNIRRSYDMFRFIYIKEKTKIQAFYGKEVRPLFGVFDNQFSLFDKAANNPLLWGIYTQFPIKGLNGTNEVYYLGFQADNTFFNDANGEETRHTIGLRRFGKLGKRWRYNSEVIFQFGEIGSNDISAFSIDTDWHYDLYHTKWKWSPGLKLEYTSGDKKVNDGKINSFNPMFVNPAFYSLAATITPVNIMSIHPSISLQPIKKLRLYAEWAVFWRASKNDGLYRPTRFINRPANSIPSRNIGHQFGGKAQFEINRTLSIDLDISYFFAGDFLKMSGEAENIFHIAPTANLRF